MDRENQTTQYHMWLLPVNLSLKFTHCSEQFAASDFLLLIPSTKGCVWWSILTSEGFWWPRLVYILSFTCAPSLLVLHSGAGVSAGPSGGPGAVLQRRGGQPDWAGVWGGHSSTFTTRCLSRTCSSLTSTLISVIHFFPSGHPDQRSVAESLWARRPGSLPRES